MQQHLGAYPPPPIGGLGYTDLLVIDTPDAALAAASRHLDQVNYQGEDDIVRFDDTCGRG